MKKLFAMLLLCGVLFLGGCAKSDTTASITVSESATSEHVHNLAIVDGYEATCQSEGLQVIGCVSCPFILEETVLEKVPCDYNGGIECKWCGEGITLIPPETLCENCVKPDESITYRQEYGANLCDTCYHDFTEGGMQGCCFCGSYVCKGDCQD